MNTLVAPPSDHLGVAVSPIAPWSRRPVCEVCRRAPASAEATSEDTHPSDSRAVLRVCDAIDCRTTASRVVPTAAEALGARVTPAPPRLVVGVHPAARGGR